jgi:hypothetical protein
MRPRRLRTVYPCCAPVVAIFPTVQAVPVQRYDRRCPCCLTAWVVTRTTVREKPNGKIERIDRLEWEKE